MEPRVFVRALVILTLLAGCGSPPPAATKKNTAAGEDVATELAAVQTALRKSGADANYYRLTLDHLNNVLGKLPDRKVQPLPADQLAKVKEDWGLTDAEAAEINRTDFTPLDAHYLHECVTFRDIARTLGLDKAVPEAKADAVLQWVNRHVRIVDHSGPPDPPALVVARGSGTALERLYVACALGNQCGIDAYLFGDRNAASDPSKLWGVIIFDFDQEHNLDLRAGLMLPPPAKKPDGSEKSKILVDYSKLATWKKLGYDLNAEKLNSAARLPAKPLTAFSPRMKTLGTLLPTVALAADAKVPAGIDRWAAAVPSTPLRVLAEMLSVEEGGTDTSPAGERRMDRYRAQLVPWGSLPQELLKVPGPLGVRVQQIFGDAATLTYQPGLADLLKEKQQRDELTQSMIRELSNAKQRDEMRKNSEQSFRPTVREDAGPSLRQLIQSGRYEDATFGLVSLNDLMRTERKRPEGGSSAASAIEWAGKVPAVYAEFLRAQRGKDPQALLQAEQAMNELAKNGQSAVKYALWLGSGISLAEANYLIALCKHDQAEARWRREPASEETKSAARTAAQSWGTFVASFPDSVTVGQAMRLQARAQELAGQWVESAESYKKAATKLNGLEKTACLILADELKPR